MNQTIQRPVKGEQPKAEWAGAVTDVCNKVQSCAMPGSLARDGAGAFGNAPLPENKRNRTGASAPAADVILATVTGGDGTTGYTVEWTDADGQTQTGLAFATEICASPIGSIPIGSKVLLHNVMLEAVDSNKYQENGV